MKKGWAGGRKVMGMTGIDIVHDITGYISISIIYTYINTHVIFLTE